MYRLLKIFYKYEIITLSFRDGSSARGYSLFCLSRPNEKMDGGSFVSPEHSAQDYGLPSYVPWPDFGLSFQAIKSLTLEKNLINLRRLSMFKRDLKFEVTKMI